ncbi:MAG: fumarate hydratase [Kiritimatiellae bacterium]|nr:fumarate hydratase [Kiritimatiellia bacterium]
MHTPHPPGLAETLAGLLRKASSELPPDVLRALSAAHAAEAPGSPGRAALGTILENAELASRRSVPACQDTGAPSFWFDLPDGTPTLPVREAVREAVAAATASGHLRLNVIEVPSGKQVASNFADGSPAIHFRFGPSGSPSRATVLLKGGGSENQSRQYSLPDSSLGAGRDLDGVRKCLLDAVWRAQGGGCAPGILGVCVGGDRAGAFAAAKEQLLRDLSDSSPAPDLAALERRVMAEAGELGVGPMGLGGRTTLLGVKIAALPRVPASYFVTVAYNCWACRRASCALSL